MTINRRPKAEATLMEAPILRLDPGMHTAMINRIDVDAAGRFLVTGSDDKTVRVWSLEDGQLLRTLRVPIGEGGIGKIFAVAISPDGARVAAGGYGPGGGTHNVYIFDHAAGRLTDRLDGLPNAILHLAFSPDGGWLVATLRGNDGIRVFETGDFRQVYEDRDCFSYYAAFDTSRRLVTTSFDGRVRLYDASFRLVHSVKAPGGERPFGVAFSPDEKRIAVGYEDSARVDTLDGGTLEPLLEADTRDVDNGEILHVAWSADGRFLYAGGTWDQGGKCPVRRWADGGEGEHQDIPLSDSTITGLRTLADGRLVFGSADPALGSLDSNGSIHWRRDNVQADFRDQFDKLAVAADGTSIAFGFKQGGGRPPG